MLILEDLLSVKDISHKFWQDADIYAVTNIFTFAQQVGNDDLSTVVGNLFNTKEISDNDTLQNFNFITSNYLDLLESIIDNYIDTGLILQDPRDLRQSDNPLLLENTIKAHQILIYLIAYCAIKIHEELQLSEQHGSYVNSLMKPGSIAMTVARKQKDYGPGNVSKFGLYGLIVRTHDKIGRLNNLLSSNRKNSVQDETVFDSLVDLVGYSIISYMWINNWFTLPMNENYSWPSINAQIFSLI